MVGALNVFVWLLLLAVVGVVMAMLVWYGVSGECALPLGLRATASLHISFFQPPALASYSSTSQHAARNDAKAKT